MLRPDSEKYMSYYLAKSKADYHNHKPLPNSRDAVKSRK